MSHTYSVVFAGELIEGFEIESVKKAFADIFQVKNENVQKYFSGKPRVVKKNLDEETAARYQRVFAKYGANVEVLKNSKSAEPSAVKKVEKTPLNKPVVKTAELEETAKKLPPVKKVTRSKLEKKDVEKTIEKFYAPVDPNANLIAQGRERKAAKMARIEIADESRSKSTLYAGIAAISFGLVDGTMSSLGANFELIQLWTSASAILIGAVMIFSSNAK